MEALTGLTLAFSSAEAKVQLNSIVTVSVECVKGGLPLTDAVARGFAGSDGRQVGGSQTTKYGGMRICGWETLTCCTVNADICKRKALKCRF